MFEDVNHNGVYDEETDILLEGVRVVISNGTVTFTVYTDSEGFYSQVLPSAGNWTVTKDDVAYAASDNFSSADETRRRGGRCGGSSECDGGGTERRLLGCGCSGGR